MRALLAVVFALAAAPPAHTVAWARTEASARVVVDLHDYYGLTLRFVAAGRAAACTGLGARSAAGWRRFRCTAWFRADEGDKFPGTARVTFVLVPAGDGADVRQARVLACSGIVCPVHWAAQRALHALEGKVVSGEETRKAIEQLREVYGLDLTAADSHHLREPESSWRPAEGDPLSVAELVAGFEAERLDPADFPHRRHVLVAWGLQQRYPTEEAYGGSSPACARSPAAPAAPTRSTRRSPAPGSSWSAGARISPRPPELFDVRLLGRCSSPAALAAGREAWVEPDLHPLVLPRPATAPEPAIARAAG